MRTFIDTKGREWALDLNTATLKRVRTLTDFDLMSLLDAKTDVHVKFYGDPVLLGDVLFALCKPTSEERGVSDEDFGAGIAGDVIERAVEALVGELVDFFPNPLDREQLRRGMDVRRTFLDRARRAAKEKAEKTDVDALVEEALQKAGLSSGSAPESSASTPAP